jgi:antitoxin component HigA of HigAB toxin-antitoxin module
MDIAPIKTQRDYRRALKRIENLMTAKRGAAEGDHLDILVALVEAWERRHYPLAFPIRWKRSNTTWIRTDLSRAILFLSSAVVTASMKCSIAGDR